MSYELQAGVEEKVNGSRAGVRALNILETIGNTPHVKINRLFGSTHDVWMKLERNNPGASIKDRIALSMIEDAENIIMDRRNSKDSSVSNLLNISDGLLADFLNVQLICTFNSSLTLIDSALMRKGRLIAKYEFGKLSIAKAQKLSDHLGFNTVISKPMTVAEISNQHEQHFKTKQIEVIGFRKAVVMEN